MKKIYILGIYGAGVVTGAFITDRLLKAKYEAIVQEELASIRSSNLQLRNAVDELVNTEEVDDDVEFLPEGAVPISVDERVNYSNIPIKSAEPLYTPTYIQTPDPSETEYPIEDDDPEEEEVDDQPTVNSLFDRTIGAYIISREQFDDPGDYEHFDRLSLMYYEEDDTLTDERDEVIDNITGAIGDVPIMSFGTASEDPNVFYVRNVDTSADIEIVRVFGSYSSIVLGLSEIDDPRTERMRRLHE